MSGIDPYSTVLQALESGTLLPYLQRFWLVSIAYFLTIKRVHPKNTLLNKQNHPK